MNTNQNNNQTIIIMRQSKFQFLALLVALMASSMLVSCGEDDPAPDPVLTVSTTSISLGEVTAGTSTTADFTITGENVTGSLSLSVTGDGFSLSASSFPVATATNTVTVTFAPAVTATPSAVTGSITISVGDLSEMISISATILEAPPTFLESGTEIFSSDFEMGKPSDSSDPSGHGSALTADDLELAGSVLEGLTLAYTVTNYDDGDPSNEDKGARVQSQRGLCAGTEDNGVADADNNDDSDGNCGNAFSIQGPGTSVEISISGLNPSQPATVTYWLRLNGSSERGLDASFSGGTTVDHAYTDGTGDSSIYTEYSISGAADENGDIVFKVEADLPVDNYSRAISVDNVTIVAN